MRFIRVRRRAASARLHARPAVRHHSRMATEANLHDEDSRRKRIFFALWPDDAARDEIARASRRAVRLSGGRPTAKRNLHVTVAFLGMLDAEGLERAAAVPPIDVGPIEIELDHVGHFEGSRVLWLGPRHVPPALVTLEQRLWDGLERAGFEREARIYRPHMTLARKARAVHEEFPPLRWRVESLSLVESVPMHRNVHYEPLRNWPL
jgi:RNA 2',3'-cyclic 3'-phosphodiesterase